MKSLALFLILTFGCFAQIITPSRNGGGGGGGGNVSGSGTAGNGVLWSGANTVTSANWTEGLGTFTFLDTTIVFGSGASSAAYFNLGSLSIPTPSSGFYNFGISSGTGLFACVNASGGSCMPPSASVPSSGLVTSNGSTLSSIAETDGDIVFGSGGSWTKGTALPSGITATTQSSSDNSTKVATTAYVQSLKPVHMIGASFPNPTGTALTTQTFCCVVAANAGTIIGWDMTVDDGTGAGTCSGCTATVKFWKVASGTTTPTSSNSINTSGISISTGTSVSSTTLTDFTTTSVSAGDRIAVAITAVSSTIVLNVDFQYQ